MCPGTALPDLRSPFPFPADLIFSCFLCFCPFTHFPFLYSHVPCLSTSPSVLPFSLLCPFPQACLLPIPHFNNFLCLLPIPHFNNFLCLLPIPHFNNFLCLLPIPHFNNFLCLLPIPHFNNFLCLLPIPHFNNFLCLLPIPHFNNFLCLLPIPHFNNFLFLPISSVYCPFPCLLPISPVYCLFPSLPISHFCPLCLLPIQFISVQDDIYALGKAHMRSTPSLRIFPNIAFKTLPMFV